MGWIDAKKQLPKSGQEVLTAFQNDHGNWRYICAHYVPESQVESDGSGESYDYYDKDQDKYFWHQGWYEKIENWGDFSSVFVCEGQVALWMPLPELPDLT